MKQYVDEKMLITLVIAAVIIFFLQHWLTKKIIKDGKVSAYVGNETLGYTKV